MIVDALLMAEPYLNFAERIHDPKRFMHLNDSILLEIERSECPVCDLISFTALFTLVNPGGTGARTVSADYS